MSSENSTPSSSHTPMDELQGIAQIQAKERIKELRAAEPNIITPDQARLEIERRYGKKFSRLMSEEFLPMEAASLARIAAGDSAQNFNTVLAGILESEINSPFLGDDIWDIDMGLG